MRRNMLFAPKSQTCCKKLLWLIFTMTLTTNGQHVYPDVSEYLPEYDFVVVGAGSGGSVMAGRLSEEANWNVLLLEVGQEENMMTDIPMTAAVTSITSYNWGYMSDPTPRACKAFVNESCPWPKGRALGGSSVINFMLYNRGNRRDFDDWAAMGNKGWSYEDVLPYFKKSENINAIDLLEDPYHGRGGPLNVERSPYISKLFAPFVAALNDLGYNETDPDGPQQLGVSRVFATMKNGRRWSAASAYLQPSANRPNLHISKKTWVVKILIDPVAKRAVGIEFLKNKKRFTVRVAKEVILAAGAIGSPQILMLSGVGPKDHLESLGIPVIQDLAVGYNLQDHPSFAGLIFLVNESVTVSQSELQSPNLFLDFVVNNRGPLTLPGGSEGMAFVKTNVSFQPAGYPDIELVLGPGSLTGDATDFTQKMVHLKKDFFRDSWGEIMGESAFSIVPILMRPKSRGRIWLRSRNPFHWPHMQPNFYHEPDDLKVMVEGIKLAIRAGESKGFREFDAKFYDQPMSGCQQLPFRSDEYFECCVQQLGTSLQHQAGTCKMGPASDKTAVVDSQLQVHGISGLRVVDASIMPILPAGHPNAVVMMIGEKAADLVKYFWANDF